MNQDEKDEDIDLDNNDDEVIGLKPDPLDDDEQDDDKADPLDAIDDIDELRNKAKGYRAVATRKSKKPVEPKPEPKKDEVQPSTSPQVDVEALVLKANGMPDDLLKELKAVAAVRQVSLLDAQTDPIFVAVKEKFESDKKRADASMGAARGGGTIKAKKGLDTPDLTREEHMKLAME